MAQSGLLQSTKMIVFKVRYTPNSGHKANSGAKVRFRPKADIQPGRERRSVYGLHLFYNSNFA